MKKVFVGIDFSKEKFDVAVILQTACWKRLAESSTRSRRPSPATGSLSGG